QRGAAPAPVWGGRVCAGCGGTLRPRVRRPGEACVRWSGRRGQAGEVSDDDRVAVRVAVSEGELRPLSGQFLAAAFAPGAGLVASGLVEVQRVAAGVDAEKGAAARILLHRAYFLLDDPGRQGEHRALVAVGMARVVEED